MWIRACAIFLIFGLASPQQTTTPQQTNQVNNAGVNANQKQFRPQFSPLTYQNTQPATNTVVQQTQNLNQNPVQPQLNPLTYQNTQFGGLNGVQPILPQFPNNPGFVNPFGNIQQLGVLPFEAGGFGSFNPLAGFQNFNQFNPLPNPQPQLFSPSIKELQVPQPYPVFVSKPVPVQIPVRVPVEVPKPYPVQIPHPVPVPVQVRVPVPVEKPYPVTITRTVTVPVEKPVYIRVPQIVPETVPQPYANVPQTVVPGGFPQAFGGSGQNVDSRQSSPHGLQIIPSSQTVTQQSQAREGTQLLGGTTVRPISNYANNPVANFGRPNLYQNGVNPNLLSEEAATRTPDFDPTRINLNAIQSNEVPNKPNQ